ncbi:hypothetical protein [Streptomyces gilvus]|uniref:hypothetical protein n=1 Tax=Streptomyces gilvus TaxID=2920937 RepID=UPI001F0DBEF8|nr:hypothetical protein [Streptomyces sp. CME 23]MCH5676349.1 hypothetical protein [Streptomyces sp. CME 23]
MDQALECAKPPAGWLGGVLIPGRYWVEAWSSEYYSYGYGTTEYDHGIALLYLEEAE